jgi:HlyD family secretion protein
MQTNKIAILALIAVVAVAGYLAWTLDKPATYLVQGEVEATRIDLSAMVTARVLDTPAGFGDRVNAGQMVVQLESAQLEAQLATAKAGVAVAEANRDVANATRPETIAASQAQLAKADADVELAQSSYDRVTQLREDSVVSQASLDQSTNSLNAAIQAKAAARANLDQAQNGTSE